MKNIFLLISVSFLLLISCKKDFLNLTPEDTYTSGVYYKTEDQFHSALAAAYATLQDMVVNDYLTSEMHSDNTVYQPFPTNRGTAIVERENISDFTNTSTNSYVAATWQYCYTGIARCNIIIQRLTASEVADSAKRDIDGQAKFLRAFYYFKLIRLFGGVPLFLEEITTAEQTFLPRSTAEEVYAQIVTDAQDAVNELNPPAGFPQTGQATKGSATVLLAEVDVFQKKWADAEALLNTLPQMGYDLNKNYTDAFSPTNKNSKESLFEIQFLGGTETSSTPNPLSFYFLPRSTNTMLLTGININNSGTGGWNTPSSDLIAAYEPGDERLPASVGILEGTYNASNYLSYKSIKDVVGYTPSANVTGVPYIKKYLHSPLEAVTGSSDDFSLYRYSDALLLLAEALNEEGRSGDALIPLNKVRERAGLPDVTTSDAILLKDSIFHERRVELAFENQRWMDLTRNENVVSIINAFGVKQRQEQPFLTANSYVIDAHNLLFPLPQSNVDLNTSLEQNPGY